MIVVPCNGPLLRGVSKNLRLYLKICRSFIYFMALSYTLRSVKPQESDLIEDGSNNFRLYLKICRSLLYFTTLGYTSRSVKPQESDLIEDGLLNLYISSVMHECHMMILIFDGETSSKSMLLLMRRHLVFRFLR